MIDRSGKAPRGQAITESANERGEALELVREYLPDREPWRAWSNFEFVDDQGHVNEVDLLVLGPRGLTLVEIKSRLLTVEGDGHSWSGPPTGESAPKTIRSSSLSPKPNASPR